MTEQQQPAVDAALERVKSSPSATVRELPDGGIAIEVEPPKRRNTWIAPAAGCVLGVVLLVVGNIMRGDDSAGPPGYVSSGPIKLMVLGALGVVFGPVALLIQVMQGPPRRVSLDVRPGTLKADRSVGGDHVVSNWGAAEVQCLFAESGYGTLFATTRMGDQQLMAFGERGLNEAIATVLASRLWQPAELEAGHVPRLKRWVVMPRPIVASGANA